MPGDRIAVCGSGGKTSLVRALSAEWVSSGFRVGITARPTLERAPAGANRITMVVPDQAGLQRHLSTALEKYQEIFIAAAGEGPHRLRGPSTQVIEYLAGIRELDYLLVEIGEGRRRRGDPRDGEFFDLPWCSAGLVVLGLGRMDRAPGQDGGRAFRGGIRPDSGLAGTSPALWALSRVSEAARWFPEKVSVSVVLNQYDLVFPRSLVWELVEELRERLARETDRVRRLVVTCGVMPQPVIGVVFCP